VRRVQAAHEGPGTASRPASFPRRDRIHGSGLASSVTRRRPASSASRGGCRARPGLASWTRSTAAADSCCSVVLETGRRWTKAGRCPGRGRDPGARDRQGAALRRQRRRGCSLRDLARWLRGHRRARCLATDLDDPGHCIEADRVATSSRYSGHVLPAALWRRAAVVEEGQRRNTKRRASSDSFRRCWSRSVHQ
jgi:hypothetical protein